MSGWVGDMVGGGIAGTQIAAHPSRIASVDFALRQFRNVQRDETHRHQPFVMGAEIRNRAVVRAGAAIEHLGVELIDAADSPRTAAARSR